MLHGEMQQLYDWGYYTGTIAVHLRCFISLLHHKSAIQQQAQCQTITEF